MSGQKQQIARSSSGTSSSSSYDPDVERLSRRLEKLQEIGERALEIGVNAAVMGVFLAIAGLPQWLARVGDSLALRIIGNGGGGLPPGGPPSGPSATISLFIFVGSCFLFLLLLRLFWEIVRAPTRATWLDHSRFAAAFRPSPYIVLFVLFLTNSDWLSTRIVRALINERTWSGFIAALLGYLYLALYALAAPKQIRYGSYPEDHPLQTSRPIIRSLLAIVATISVGNMAYLLLTLFPSAFSAAPDEWSWWCMFWPPECHGRN